MADYISQFTGGEIDRRLAKVSDLEAGKQDKLESGENIKTVGGQSLLGAGNIPLTDQEAVKFTPQTLTAAQKAQAQANIGAASEEEVAALADQKYEGPYATSGDLPAASASTMGAIYLVGPDANGEYDRYVTKLNGSTYTWASLGKTSIDLANYATKAEVGELEAKVTDLQDGETVLQQQINAIHPVIIEGNVENAPDEEDITTDDNNSLKFANRSATLTNKGYKILRKDATFADQVTDINTIYEIRYDFVVDSLPSLPSGCRLLFNGGAIVLNGNRIESNTADALVFGMIPDVAEVADYNAERLASTINAGFIVSISQKYYIGSATSKIINDVKICGNGSLVKTSETASFIVGASISIDVRGIGISTNFTITPASIVILFQVNTEDHFYLPRVVFDGCSITGVRVYTHIADDVNQVTVKDGVKELYFRNNTVDNIGLYVLRVANCLGDLFVVENNTFTRMLRDLVSFGLNNDYQTLSFPRLKSVIIKNNFLDNSGVVLDDSYTYTDHCPFSTESDSCVFEGNTIQNIVSKATANPITLYAFYLSSTSVTIRNNYIKDVVNLGDSTYNECFKCKASLENNTYRVIENNTYIITDKLTSSWTGTIPSIKMISFQGEIGTVRMYSCRNNTIDIPGLNFAFGAGTDIVYKSAEVLNNTIRFKTLATNAVELFRLSANADNDGTISIRGNKMDAVALAGTTRLYLIRANNGYNIDISNNLFQGIYPANHTETNYANLNIRSVDNSIVLQNGITQPWYEAGTGYVRNIIKSLGGSFNLSPESFNGNRDVTYIMDATSYSFGVRINIDGANGPGFYRADYESSLGESSIFVIVNPDNSVMIWNDSGDTLTGARNVSQTVENLNAYINSVNNVGRVRFYGTYLYFEITSTFRPYQVSLRIRRTTAVPTYAFSHSRNSLLNCSGTFNNNIRPILVFKDGRIGYASSGIMYGANGLRDGALAGATADRPSLAAADKGFIFFDTTLGKSIVWNGSAWVNMDGTALS